MLRGVKKAMVFSTILFLEVPRNSLRLMPHPVSHSETVQLEVSSPGLNRPLRRESDFLRFAGQRARVTTLQAVAGQRRFLGVLRGYEDGRVLLEREDGATVLIPYALISKARLDPVL